MYTLTRGTMTKRPDISHETYLVLARATVARTEDAVPNELLDGYLDLITGEGGGLKCNVVRMLCEHYEVMSGDTQPSFAYVSEGKSELDKGFYVTGWMGNVYGRCWLGRMWHDNSGGERRSVNVTINGRDYYGTNFGGPGMYCRLKPCKVKESK